ncbi:hypothetical protein Z951_43230 [Streptomyces sp. PRh5]|uniref:AzlC family ABC transporter permease n=1 Tax=Streptomyces sp. PRh5 TaxID=1158056 RepID=UPI000450B3A3|nr:AzlC family ABC transporter permease [Streptomyces sp. PRh5]EXU62134.1 hypothetical protein Z951_43230 [Streptomyces sp. PRh5]
MFGTLSAAAIGVSFGAIAVASGVPGWLAITMSVFIHAGGAQLLSFGLLAVGNSVAAVADGLLLNAPVICPSTSPFTTPRATPEGRGSQGASSSATSRWRLR